MKVTKAIIPAAGLGTRFLPQTKAMPKEMLPIVDKPVIQLIVEELVEAGVTDIIIVTGPQKRAIEDHFDRAADFEQALLEKGKTKEAKQVRDIAELANFVYVRQKGEPKGNARPVLNAAHLLGDEPFFVIFPDDFFHGGVSGSAKQMAEVFERYGSDSPVLSLIELEDINNISKYASVKVVDKLSDDVVSLTEIVEKPDPKDAPSNLASVSGYLLTNEILKHIAALNPPEGGEISITDALKAYAQDNRVLGKVIDGIWYDCGNKEGYLRAVLAVAKQDPSVNHLFK